MTRQDPPTPHDVRPDDEPADDNSALENEDNRPVARKFPGNQEKFSPASQVGRSRTAGGSESVLDPDEDVREGWPAPDQSDAPSEWPEPTVD